MIYFYGAGKVGKRALQRLKQYRGDLLAFAGFIDANSVGECEGFPIFRPNEIDLQDSSVVITVRNWKLFREMFQFLKINDSRKIFLYGKWNDYLQYDKDSFLDCECYDISEWDDQILLSAEMHIADGCNLNCRGCCHFSPIFPRHQFPDFYERVRDIEKLSRKFSHIVFFSILGGEPLLNEQVGEYCMAARKILHETTIFLTTNGLLIPSISEVILEQIAKSGVVVRISAYEPTLKHMDAIVERLKRYEIAFLIDEREKDVFQLPLSLDRQSHYPKRCFSDGCVNIANNRIARCPTLMYIEAFNEYFSLHLPEAGIMSLDTKIEGTALLDELQKEVPLCEYCIDHEIPWARCGKMIKLADFAVDN